MRRGWRTPRQPAAACLTNRRRNNSNSRSLKKSQKVRNLSKLVGVNVKRGRIKYEAAEVPMAA